jgi:glycerol-3-phosphate O-acyltransferase/dihydroxyacetone phosphate acyltransferase
MTEPGTPAVPRPGIVQLARVLVGLFFRTVELEGAENVPRDGPLLVVANHHNSLVDPALLLAQLPRSPRFLAKSTLWQLPLLRQLLDGAAAIPVYRQQDTDAAGRDPHGTDRQAGNQTTFARCWEVLAAGGVVALFPEGISHDAPHLAPLKTGAARIALEAEAAHGPLGIRVLPVGLTFDDKGTFRSRALIHVGAPLDLDAERKAHATEPRETVRTLTTRIDDALREVTLNYRALHEVELVERTAEVLARDAQELPTRLALAEAAHLRRTVMGAYARLRAVDPVRVEAVRRRAERYAERLAQLDLRDDQIASRYPTGRVALWAVGSLSLLMFWLPLALVGTVLNGVPYWLCGVAARFTRTDDLPATYKLMGGMVLFPIFWALEAALAWHAGWSGWATLGVFFAGPITAWFGVLFHERYDRFLAEAATWLRLKLPWSRARALREERAALHAELRELEDRDPNA